jgi:asparagine synthetase B (glutamine-hydrolysing)
MAGRLCAIAGHTLGGPLGRRFASLSDLLAGDHDHFLMHAFMGNSQPDAIELLRDRDWCSGAQEPVWRNDLAAGLETTRGHVLLNRLLYLELFGFLPDHNLNYTDKAAMAEGVECRVPYTDRRLFTFMADVPPAAKLEGRLHAMTPKAFFKRAVRARLPAGITQRSKTGFGAPWRPWLTTGRGKALMEGALFDTPVSRDLFVTEALETFWRRTCTGQLNGINTALAAAKLVWWWEAIRHGDNDSLATATAH